MAPAADPVRLVELRQQELPNLVELWGKRLEVPADSRIDGRKLLHALARQESTSGRDGGHARVEKAYQPGGGLHRRHVVELFAAYGDAAVASWSSWQIMYPTAWELGMRGQPWDLWDDGEAGKWVVRFIERRAFRKGARTVREVADAYNSGTHRDAFQPKRYMDRVERFYMEALLGPPGVQA